MKKFMKEFKEFISRGNVMDMAVGVIIGGAFTGIVSSLVEDIINPLLGLFGGMNFDQFSVTLMGTATLNYGKFITAVINFLIMALVVFLIVRTMNKAAPNLLRKRDRRRRRQRSVFIVRVILRLMRPDVLTVRPYLRRNKRNGYRIVTTRRDCLLRVFSFGVFVVCVFCEVCSFCPELYFFTL